jgi:hypothetical protein
MTQVSTLVILVGMVVPVGGSSTEIDTVFCWKAISGGIEPQNTSLMSIHLSVAPADSDDVWIAWSENGAKLQHWNGRTWDRVPGPSASNGMALDPVIRVSPDGTAFIAWRTTSDRQSVIRVSQWSGENWTALGESLNAFPEDFTNGGNADLIIDNVGKPVVAWHESGSLSIARWSGTEWRGLGGLLTKGSDHYHLDPSLAVDTEGAIWVAWNGGTASKSFVRVSKWANSKWHDIGMTVSGILHRSSKVQEPSIVVLPEGRIFVAWLERDIPKNSQLALALWDGTMWAPLAPPSLSDETEHHPWLPSVSATGNGDPVLAWTGRDETDISSVFIYRLLSDGWARLLPKMHLDGGQSDASRVLLNPMQNGEFLVAWDEPGNDERRIRVIQVSECSEGEEPAKPPEFRPRESFWPSTVDEAVSELVSELETDQKARISSMAREDLIQFHLGWGMGIRNRFGLWAGNKTLLRSCGGKEIHPDDCSMIIIERVWERLQDLKKQPRPHPLARPPIPPTP